MYTKFLEKRGMVMDMAMKKNVKRGVDIDMDMDINFRKSYR